MSTYTSFIKLTTISADDMNNNFNHCFAGDWLPLSGASLTTDTTETLDMGSQTDSWNTLYCNNLNIDGEIKQAFNLIAEVTLSSTVSAIEFTNLDGDKDETWLLNIYTVLSATSTSMQIKMVFNGDSGTNYCYQQINAQGASLSASRNIRDNFEVGYTPATTTARRMICEGVMYSKTGNERLMISENMTVEESSSYVNILQLFGHIWNNTSSTITSIKIYTDENNFCTNTNIQIWAKTTTITARSITITET